MGIRREARKIIVRVLYVIDVIKVTEKDAWDMVDVDGKSGKIIEFAANITKGTMEHLEYLDNIILKYTKNWEMERIASVDKAILRMGLYEIHFEDTIPKNVSINEAVELAKYFSTDKSHKFVNGILDSSVKEIGQ